VFSSIPFFPSVRASQSSGPLCPRVPSPHPSLPVSAAPKIVSNHHSLTNTTPFIAGRPTLFLAVQNIFIYFPMALASSSPHSTHPRITVSHIAPSASQYRIFFILLDCLISCSYILCFQIRPLFCNLPFLSPSCFHGDSKCCFPIS